ncbi:hypothetical protein [Streptomyces sp. R41]|uniref:Uncharacterized protein n=1 Tax=Streptomyces sp. R41 TaxID=3238632 RepID=A0AB39RKC4_9ACTN
MTKKWIHSAVLAASCSALALTAACGTQHAQDQQTVKTRTEARSLPDTESRAKWPTARVQSGLAAGMRLPLEDYMVSYPDEVDVENAKDKVKTACMARLGFTFTPPASGTTPALSYDGMNMERRYGITDAKTARTYGYHVPGAAAEPADDTAAEEAEEGRTDNWYDALENTCIPEANKKVGILYETDIAGDLAAESLEATKSSLKVQAAMSNWSACMARKNYKNFPEPLQAGEAFAESAGTQPSQTEIDTAVADVDCKESSGLVKNWFSAETGRQTQQIGDHKAELEAEKARNAKMIEAARAILGQS